MTAQFPIPDLKNIRSNKVGFYFHWILNSWWSHFGSGKSGAIWGRGRGSSFIIWPFGYSDQKQ